MDANTNEILKQQSFLLLPVTINDSENMDKLLRSLSSALGSISQGLKLKEGEMLF